MTHDIVAFLRERLDEDEHLARNLATFADGTGAWRVSGGGLATGAYELLAEHRAAGQLSSWHLAHIARHDPARVLREVEAKRAILTAYLAADDHGYVSLAGFDSCSDSCAENILEAVLETLARAWSDHPDFDESWALPTS